MVEVRWPVVVRRVELPGVVAPGVVDMVPAGVLVGNGLPYNVPPAGLTVLSVPEVVPMGTVAPPGATPPEGSTPVVEPVTPGCPGTTAPVPMGAVTPPGVVDMGVAPGTATWAAAEKL